MARLRNRILKADFWSDGELLRWPREKRWLYAGLYSLSEDSGCLEDDPFTWKCLLFPSPLDADITTEKIETWRDELCEVGKLTPYFAEGKQHLYINSFHEHEHPRNPQLPNVPLPQWVKWEPLPDKPHRGSYRVLPVAANRLGHGKKALAAPKGLAKLNGNGEADEEFLAFWTAYPRGENKQPALRAWRRLTKAERRLALGIAQIMGEMVRTGSKEATYVPYAQKFLNQKQWENWRDGVPVGWQDESAARQAQQDATLDAALAEMAAEEAK